MKNNRMKILLSLLLILVLLLPFALSEEIPQVADAPDAAQESLSAEESVETDGVAVEAEEAAVGTEALEEVPLEETLPDDDLAEDNRVRVVNTPVDPFPARLTLGVKETFALDAADRLGATGAITYATSNKKVVTVNRKTGAVKAKKTGSAKITAKWNGKKVVCKVTVKKAPKKVTAPKKLTIALDDIVALKAKLPGKTASRLTYTSDNPAVAAVDNTGNVYGMGVGTATITVSTFNKKKAKCVVTVIEHGGPDTAVADFTIENGVVTGYSGAGGKVSVPRADAEGNAVYAIGERAFAGNGNIAEIYLPASVTEIGASAFEGCTALETVHMSNGVSSIGKAAFKSCAKLSRMNAYG